MLKHATTLTVVGFLLFILGTLTLVLNYVGVDVYGFAWLYLYDSTLSYVVRVLMILLGIILIYVGRTNWEQVEV